MEALRLGCDAFASDLNPVAGLILKTLLEDISRRGPELADELRAAGAKIKAQAEAELADLYPSDPDGTPEPGRRHAHCLPVGAHGALRKPQLRR